MTSIKRREEIINFLKGSTQPISATSLASNFNVSRQVIVGDIALLRASSINIIATPRGYVIESPMNDGSIIRTIVCNHSSDDTLKELYIIVDHGGCIMNVIVEHPIYGQLCGELQIASRYDADNFLEKTKEHNALSLSTLTNGIHLHTIKYSNEATFERILAALKNENILFYN